MSKERRPLIRWAGSKRQLLPRLEKFWSNEFERYVEPFAGSAALYFRLCPPKALLGDLNYELINTYRQVKQDPDGVWHYLSKLTRNKEEYLFQRALNPADLDSGARAARFIFLNRLCFNGLYRTNKRGEFNVPYGGDKSGKLPLRHDLLTCSEILKSANFLSLDFESTLDRTREGDFVFIDPPYSTASRRTFSDYTSKVFTNYDIDRLSRALSRLNRKKVKFVVSFAECSEGRGLLEEWQPKRVWTKRHISGFIASRRGAYELLGSNISQ